MIPVFFSDLSLPAPLLSSCASSDPSDLLNLQHHPVQYSDPSASVLLLTVTPVQSSDPSPPIPTCGCDLCELVTLVHLFPPVTVTCVNSSDTSAPISASNCDLCALQ